MVVIRLSRTGSKKRPFYHLVVVDSRAARDSGTYIERLGYFNPVAKGAEIRLHIEQERIDHWIKNGAQPSERVAALIKEAKLAKSGVSLVEKKQDKRVAQKQKADQAKAAEAAEKAKAIKAAEAEAAAAEKAKAAEAEAAEKAKAAEAEAAAAPEADTKTDTDTESQ